MKHCLLEAKDISMAYNLSNLMARELLINRESPKIRFHCKNGQILVEGDKYDDRVLVYREVTDKLIGCRGCISFEISYED